MICYLRCSMNLYNFIHIKYIHTINVCSLYTGGAGVAEQIGELKRGADIVVCTPGRMIDILTMQAGKLVSFKRVSYVVMDEADRM